MPDEPRDLEGAVEEPEADVTVNDEQREVKEPGKERWWENPGQPGEVH